MTGPAASALPGAAPTSWRRRHWLLAPVAALAAPAALRAATPVSWPTGWVKPRDLPPPLELTDSQGRRRPLADRLRGQATAVQLVFTGCGTTCPTQGALFSHMAARHQGRRVQWLSISIDALGDDPPRLRAWQARLGAQPAWQAAVPAVADVDRLVAFLRGGPATADAHTTQVFAFDREGRLAYRTGDQTPVALLDQLVDAVA